MRTHSRRKNHYEKIPLSIYIILVLYYKDKPLYYYTLGWRQSKVSVIVICNRFELRAWAMSRTTLHLLSPYPPHRDAKAIRSSRTTLRATSSVSVDGCSGGWKSFVLAHRQSLTKRRNQKKPLDGNGKYLCSTFASEKEKRGPPPAPPEEGWLGRPRNESPQPKERQTRQSAHIEIININLNH